MKIVVQIIAVQLKEQASEIFLMLGMLFVVSLKCVFPHMMEVTTCIMVGNRVL